MKSPLLRRSFSLALYGATALLLAYFLIRDHSVTLPIGDPAPLEDKIALLNGNATLKRLQKGPLLLNFWATWCPPCQKELPALVAIARRYQGRVTVVGAAVASPKEDILALKSALQIPFVLGQVEEAVSKKWRAEALPTTYLIDTKGRIAWAHAGVVTEGELKEQIDLLLQGF